MHKQITYIVLVNYIPKVKISQWLHVCCYREDCLPKDVLANIQENIEMGWRLENKPYAKKRLIERQHTIPQRL